MRKSLPVDWVATFLRFEYSDLGFTTDLGCR